MQIFYFFYDKKRYSCKKIKRSDGHTIELLKLIPNVHMGYGHSGEYSLGKYAWILEDIEPFDN